ncbi:MAG: hypothetical protein QNK37_39030 [Acidobacteriota bacterium]|nr:hypothetical protein [Acidobacteriota bacterium]
MLLAMLFTLLLFDEGAEQPPYYVVLTNKKIMKVMAPPQFQGKLATVTLLDGKVTSLPVRMIDQAETEKYNQRVAEKMERERLAAEARAEEEAKVKARREALRKKKQESLRNVELREFDELPKYERPDNTVAKPPETESKPAGDPMVKNFTSDDPVFVSQETIRPYDDHIEVICKVKVQAVNGAGNIKVKLKVRYDKEAGDEIEQAVEGNLAYNGEAVITFRLDKTDTIVDTFYTVSADIVP